MADHDLLIGEDGAISFVFDDELIDVFDGEPQTTRRVSTVEPADGGGWTADMALAGYAVVLGPFRTRQAALNAEREFIRKEMGL